MKPPEPWPKRKKRLFLRFGCGRGEHRTKAQQEKDELELYEKVLRGAKA